MNDRNKEPPIAHRPGKQGFTIIELMVTMALTAFGILGFFFLENHSIQARTFAREMDRAVDLALSRLEELRAAGYDSSNLADNGGDTSPTKYPSEQGTAITVNGGTELYHPIQRGRISYFYRYEVLTDQRTETKLIKLYVAWYLKDNNPGRKTATLTAHSLGAPLSIIIADIK